ncbi:MAG: hypothetical protein Q4F00_01830 [bacterium]|nr:hypothetical protein [bacterium]
MNKFFTLAVASALLLSLNACTENTQDQEPTTLEQALPAAAPAEPASSSGASGSASEYEKAHAQGQLTACKSNLKNIGTALEMWQSDHDGKLPEKLSEVTTGGPYGGYLKVIPSCPAARGDSYSSSYKRSADGKNYEVYCSGHNHALLGIPKNRPGFTSEMGLIEK